jgi:hypothetical protein
MKPNKKQAPIILGAKPCGFRLTPAERVGLNFPSVMVRNLSRPRNGDRPGQEASLAGVFRFSPD